MNNNTTPEVIWRPFPGSQEIALDSRADHTLYHGTRGPGKTITQLMRFLKQVGRGYGQFWRGIIFDMEFDNLNGLVAESKKWFKKFNDGAVFLESAVAYKWVWPTGEELLFRHVKRVSDYEKFHGWEIPFLGWNELTKQPNSELYDKMMSINRSSFDPETNTPRDPKTGLYLTPNGLPLPPIPLEVFSTTNPNGVGHSWVKRRFIDPAPSGHLVRQDVMIFNPKTQEEEIYTKTQIAIFGSYKENPLLPASYIAELESITDENRRRAWLEGDWDVTSGGALDDLWESTVHIVPRFIIPDSWYVDRTYDNGTVHPFSVGWWAEADGTEAEIIINGESTTFCPAPGSLIQIFELYGSNSIGSNKGVGWSSKTIAEHIIKIENMLLESGWITQKPRAGAADNKIRETNTDADNMEKIMSKLGVNWIKSDKYSGSRKVGLQLVRERLENSVSGEGPGLYFMRNCRASIQTLPGLPRDLKNLDDVDTDSEDHAYDMVRYRILQGARKTMSTFKVLLPT